MENKISPATLKLKQSLIKAHLRSEEEKIKDFEELKNDPNSIFSKLIFCSAMNRRTTTTF